MTIQEIGQTNKVEGQLKKCLLQSPKAQVYVFKCLILSENHQFSVSKAAIVTFKKLKLWNIYLFS